MLHIANVNVDQGSRKVIRKNEGMLPPTSSASRGTTIPVSGGVEAYNDLMC